MKKLLIFLLTLIISVCGLSLVACGNGSDDGIAGTYNFYSMEYEDKTFIIGDEAPWGDDILATTTVVLVLNDDGTLSFDSIVGGNEVSNPGTWTYENDVLTLTMQGAALNTTVAENGDISAEMFEITYTFRKA